MTMLNTIKIEKDFFNTVKTRFKELFPDKKYNDKINLLVKNLECLYLQSKEIHQYLNKENELHSIDKEFLIACYEQIRYVILNIQSYFKYDHEMYKVAKIIPTVMIEVQTILQLVIGENEILTTKLRGKEYTYRTDKAGVTYIYEELNIGNITSKENFRRLIKSKRNKKNI